MGGVTAYFVDMGSALRNSVAPGPATRCEGSLSCRGRLSLVENSSPHRPDRRVGESCGGADRPRIPAESVPVRGLAIRLFAR